MTGVPIACTLTPGEAAERGALVEGLAADALIERREIAGGMAGRFRDGPGVEQRLRDLAAAEARCCAFLSIAVRRDDGGLWLEITGPPEVAPIIEGLLAAR